MATPEWSRVVNTTIAKYIRDVEVNILRNRKLLAMLEGTATDGRLRGQFRYCGAVTGRWKSRGEPDFRGREGNGVQLQNLPKNQEHFFYPNE